jgi:hypothetical protein
MDWKFGQLPVAPARDNIQLKAYALGVFERFPSVLKLEAALVTPRMEERYTHHAFWSYEAEDIRAELEGIIAQANSPFKKPNGGSHCAYCTNKPQCPVLNEAARATADELNLLPIPRQEGGISLITPEDRTKAMLLASILPDWATLVKRECTRLALEHGEETPMFSVRRRIGNLAIKDLNIVLDFAQEHGVSRERILLDASSVSLSKLTDILMETAPIPEITTKRDYSVALEAVLGDAVSRSPDVVYLQKSNKLTAAEVLEQVTTET